MTELYTAILLAKQSMKAPSKNRKAMYGKYADLESVLAAVEGPLAQEGVIISQTCQDTNEKLYLRTSVIHTATGQAIHNDVPILMKNPNNPQELGGAITYARRYGIISILGVVADDDDDGNTAAGKAADGSPAQQKPQNPQKAVPQPARQVTQVVEESASEPQPEAPVLTEKMVQALIMEFERAGYQGADMMHAIQQVAQRKFGQLYNLTEAEGRAAVAWARKNKRV